MDALSGDVGTQEDFKYFNPPEVDFDACSLAYPT